MNSRPKKGFSAFTTVEILLSIAVFTLMVTGLAGAFSYSMMSQRDTAYQEQASALLDEALQATANIGEGNFSSLSTGSHGLALVSGAWTFSGTSDVTGNFTRSVTISTVDANTVDATAAISWTSMTGSKSITGLRRLSNWKRSYSPVSWSNPSNPATSNYDLTGTNALTHVTSSGTYIVGVRANTTNNFVIMNTSTPTSPSLTSTFSVGGTPSDIAVSGNYAYVSTNQASGQVTIVNFSNPATPSLAATIKLAGNTAATGVAVVGNYLYITRSTSANPVFYIYNISTPTSPSAVGSLAIAGISLNDIVVSGNYAYCSSSSTTGELYVINISTPSTPAVTKIFDLTGAFTGGRVRLFNSTTLLESTSSNNLFVVNITTPATPAILGTYAAGGTINGIGVMAPTYNYAMLATSNANSQLEIIDLTTLTAPKLLSPGIVKLTGGNLDDITYIQSQNMAWGGSTIGATEFMGFQPN